MELKFEDANASTKNATTKKPVTTKPSRTNCKDPKNLDKEVVSIENADIFFFNQKAKTYCVLNRLL